MTKNGRYEKASFRKPIVWVAQSRVTSQISQISECLALVSLLDCPPAPNSFEGIMRLKKRTKYNKEYARKYRQKNIEKQREYNKDYRNKNRERVREWGRQSDIRNRYRVWASKSIHKHKEKGFDVMISLDELSLLAEKTTHCMYCGCKLWYGPKDGKVMPNSPALDRKNNGVTITCDNVDITCIRCGRTKNDRTHNEFVQYCIAIVKKYGSEVMENGKVQRISDSKVRCGITPNGHKQL
jgi:hypothetical protein